MKSDNMLEIVEIIRQADSGTQEPFICRGMDQEIYYVKGGRRTNRSSLIHEHLCAALAQRLGLPQPPFHLAHISEDLIEETPAHLASIGAGVSFASQERPGCTLLTPPQVDSIPLELRQKLLVFDWWILNGDRQDWNSNLLWDQSSMEVTVIDHNLAFDHTLSLETFLEYHIFREDWHTIDLAARAQYQALLCDAMSSTFLKACGTIPEEWFFLPPDCVDPANIDLNWIQQTLARCESDKFWRLP